MLIKLIQKYKNLLTEHYGLSLTILILLLSASIVFIASVEYASTLVGFVIFGYAYSILRLYTYRHNPISPFTDSLFLKLFFRKREDKYEEASLNHCVVSSLITSILFIVYIVIIVIKTIV